MGLKEALEETRPLPIVCAIAQYLGTLPEEDASALSDALHKVRNDERQGKAKVYSSQWLADTLSDNGYPISRSTVARHINGECGCGKAV